jgi:hypothetical protein
MQTPLTQAAWTDAQGRYALGGVQPGSYALTEVHPAYSFELASIRLALSGDASGKSFMGTPIRSFGTIYLPLMLRRGDPRRSPPPGSRRGL